MEGKSEEKGVSCSECGAPPQDTVVVKLRKTYCRKCWKYQCDFKFRKRLFEVGRPAKGTVGEVFKPAETVLICYDGSPTAVALINLALNAFLFGNNLQNQVPGSTNLPFPFKFAIVVMLESELNGSPGVEGRQKKHIQSLLKWCRHATANSGLYFPLHLSSMEMSLKMYHNEDSVYAYNKPLFVTFESSDEIKDDQGPNSPESQSNEVDKLVLPFHESMDHHLMELRKSLKTKTEEKDFLSILKGNLMIKVAEELKINKIVVPESQTTLAVKMFSMMSLGRGCQVADEMSFISKAENGLLLARPLIDFSEDDIHAYLETLEKDSVDGLINKGGKRKMKIDSVDRQCDDFIVNLQRGYPATVSTLTKIGGKLQSSSEASPSESGNSGTMCRFCQKQSDAESTSCTPLLCYGCQNFLVDAHPDKKEYFKHLFS